MELSVITVCYNAVNVIEKTIMSVIRQSYDDFEYIVIDGNSVDGTVNIIQKYIDNIDYFLTEPDTGIYNAMNKGVSVARGKYCLFLNAGDAFINKDVLTNVIPFLTGESVISGNEIEIKNGKVEDYIIPPNKIDFPFLCNNSLRHQSTFIRTDLLKSHAYDETFKIASDWKFWFEQLYVNGLSYKPVDVDICLFAKDGISTNDKTDLASKEREKVIYNTLGSEWVCRYKNQRKKNIFQYIIYRIIRRFKRQIRLIRYRCHFELIEIYC